MKVFHFSRPLRARAGYLLLRYPLVYSLKEKDKRKTWVAPTSRPEAIATETEALGKRKMGADMDEVKEFRKAQKKKRRQDSRKRQGADAHRLATAGKGKGNKSEDSGGKGGKGKGNKVKGGKGKSGGKGKAGGKGKGGKSNRFAAAQVAQKRKHKKGAVKFSLTGVSGAASR